VYTLSQIISAWARKLCCILSNSLQSSSTASSVSQIAVGETVGSPVGDADGLALGEGVGVEDGNMVGLTVVGLSEGDTDGPEVG
jgi:hypothetical protein